jgi:hypothetical protein
MFLYRYRKLKLVYVFKRNNRITEMILNNLYQTLKVKQKLIGNFLNLIELKSPQCDHSCHLFLFLKLLYK